MLCSFLVSYSGAGSLVVAYKGEYVRLAVADIATDLDPWEFIGETTEVSPLREGASIHIE
jgi:hypothetical protein